jgi:hypothetical protein
VNGFGKIWSEYPEVRKQVGCPTEREYAITEAAHERFEGGYMFWRQDIKKIYVFYGDPNTDLTGTWQEYDDTWQEGEPLPKATATPPAGKYAPVRGFGKLWYSNSDVREKVGWAVEPEQGVTGAFQSFERGYALWTADKVIRFMYNDRGFTDRGIWHRFIDTFVMPTATPSKKD